MSNQQKKILLVEDNDSLRELVNMILELEGYQLMVAENGQKAIEILAENSVDLVVLDLFMPIMDGVHVLNWLRLEQKSNTPVLVMTAMTDDKTRQNMIDAGANDVIQKPLDMDKVVTSVKQILQA